MNIVLYKNDVLTLTFTLQQNGQPVDLTGATVYFHLRSPGGTVIVSQQATIVSATEGKISVDIDNQVTGTAGIYIYEIEVQTSAGDKYTAVKAVFTVSPAIKA